jgi:uncharacterized protein
MKIAIFSDTHDNMTRWSEAEGIIKAEGIEVGICCGDVTSIESLEEMAQAFKTLYLALGNADFKLKNTLGMIPDNVKWFEKIGALEIDGRKIAIVHNDRVALNVAESDIYDLVFYGHTHTPWEKKIGKTILLNSGEIAGQYGPASFCIYDLKNLKGSLKLLK